MSKLKNVVVLDENKLKAIAEGEVKFDNRTNNPGRPVNKKSARYKRLAKQAFYADVNSKFVSGKAFTLKENQQAEYHYTPNADRDGGALFNGIGHYVCNIDYIGRTKVTGFTYVLDKRVNVEVNLKEVQFVK
tara:strand:- start:231 stop:626 length:396 start_codon:yes stop_codon:yes gene_type:complete